MNLSDRKNRIIILFSAVPAFYIMFAGLLTLPLVFGLGTSVCGGLSDSYGTIWQLWWKNAAKYHAADPVFCNLVNSPFGAKITFGIQPVYEFMLFSMAKAIGEITAYNLWVMAGFVFSALAMFFLVFNLTGSLLASAFAGLAFGFSPYAVSQSSGGHIGFVMNFWLPLYVWSLLTLSKELNLRRAFVSGIFLALVTMTSLYYGFFTIVFSVFFLIFHLVRIQKDTPDHYAGKKLIDRCFIVLVSAVIIMIPFYWKTIPALLAGFADPAGSYHRNLNLYQLVNYSARPWDYFLPPIDNPFLGHLTEKFVRGHLHGSNVHEQTLYLGWTLILLCLAGFFMAVKGYLSEGRRRYFWFFFSGAVVMAFISGPPYFPACGTRIPLVSWFLYSIAPMFRVYARIGVFVMLCMAGIAGLVLSELGDRIKIPWKKASFFCIVVFFLLFELSSSNSLLVDVSKTPAVYSWLSEQKQDFSVAEYPMAISIDYNHYAYLFWQRLHRKRLVNGAPEGSVQDKIRQKLENLNDPMTPVMLRKMGVKYIIIHAERYIEGRVPGPMKRYYPDEISSQQFNNGVVPVPGGKFVLEKDFGVDRIYLVK